VPCGCHPEHGRAERGRREGSASSFCFLTTFLRFRENSLLGGWQHFGREVGPGGVAAFDQYDLFFAAPLFDLFLAQNGVPNIGEHFEVDEAGDLVFRCEARDHSGAVFGDASRQVIGDACVDRRDAVRAGNNQA